MTNQPNVLLITTDHWPAALLGVAGHPAIQTPTLDELACSGVHYTNCYSEAPVCIAARRTLMTGVSPQKQGARFNDGRLPMPNLPTLAQTFRQAGYQARAVGKLHVYPQRDRIGFNDVILDEEGRLQFGVLDDYALFLGDRGFAGRQFEHGMSNNQYWVRPWHLPEETHPTNWATNQMARLIKRRDPTKPNFWYLAYRHPHPPLTPLPAYLDLYRDIPIDLPYQGAWSAFAGELPYLLRMRMAAGEPLTAPQITAARRGLYALCTHIDHQLRVIIGTLREEGLLDETIICFTADHGDMLGNHHLWAKGLFYENSANVPLILVGAKGDDRIGFGQTDSRLVGWQDVMPTLLDLAGIDIPETVEGLSTVSAQKRDWLFGEYGNQAASINYMIRESRFKLIYYPVGNYVQLFDMPSDPHELIDLATDPAYAEIVTRLSNHLIQALSDDDRAFVQAGQLRGLPDQSLAPGAGRGMYPRKDLRGQRGSHWPPPPGRDES